LLEVTLPHAKQRDRRMMLSMLAGFPVRALQILSGILVVPLAYRYLGAERFGLWSAVTALGSMLTLADFGIGNGLITTLSVATGREEPERIRRAISTAILIVGAIAALLLIALGALVLLGDWAGWLNVAGTSAAGDARPAGAACVMMALLLLPVGLAAKIRTGLQEAFRNSAWDAAGVVLMLGLFVAAIRFDTGMAGLAVALGTGPVLAALGNGIGLWRRQSLRPRWSAVDFEGFRPVARLGLLYFALACSAAMASAADNLIAIKLLGPESAGSIGIAGKIFGASQAVVIVALLPLWPAFGEALARGDHRWARRALWRSVAMAFGISLLGAVALLAVANPAIRLWLGRDTALPMGLLVANAVWLVLQSVGNVFGMLLNGAGVIRFQIATSVSYAVIAVALKFVLTDRIGMAGIVWGTVISYGLVALPLYVRYARRHLDRVAAAA
jgi:O-antigen/teichoic acid export membrane protein